MMNLSSITATLPRSATALLLYRLIAVLALFFLFDHGLNAIAKLDHHYLDQSVLLMGVFRKMGWLWCLVLAVALIASLRYGRILISWEMLDNGPALRGFIILLATVLGMAFAVQGYNYYFDHGYYLDRILVIAFLGLTIWRPIFLLPFVVALYPLIWQWNLPLGGYLYGTIGHVLQILILFSAWLTLGAFNKRQRASDFLFLTLCVTASAYWVPGILKFNLDWLSFDRIQYMPIAAYTHGWLGHLEPRQVVAIAQAIEPFEKPLHLCVLLFET